MPTINFSLKDLNKLVGKDLSISEVEDLVEYGKGELESFDGDDIKVNFDDTNLPYLWSVEGVSRMIKGKLNLEVGIPKFKTIKKNYYISVDKSVSKVRPYIASAIVEGNKLDDYMIKQLIQLQEKFSDSYGKRRRKVAVGIYPLDKINFPLNYKTVKPDGVKFVPLGLRNELNLNQILKEHPTGKQYSFILDGEKEYPILLDSNNEILSFPPIINSEKLGRLSIGDNRFFIEATGNDFEAVNLAINIFTQALFERNFKIIDCEIKYSDKTITTPYLFNQSIKIKLHQFKHLTGIDLDKKDFKRYLEMARYNFKGDEVIIPNYRNDILHWVDVAEDVLIVYGFNNVEVDDITDFTIGNEFKINSLINNVRAILAGFGFQEILSPMLTSKNILFDKMNISEFNIVEIEDFISENYSVVRNWLLPGLMDFLNKNKRYDYPQKIFEEGLVTINGKFIEDVHRISLVVSHKSVDFTEIKQIFESLMRLLNLKADYRDIDHSSFISGRVARASINGKDVAYLGELNPEVLENFQLTMPVVGFEINLSLISDML